MNHPTLWRVLPLILLCAHAWADVANTPHTQELSPVVVTPSLSSHSSHSAQINPKSAVQPLSASDGAGVLQSVPNMSVIRKGGSSGDPLLRGLGGSRLGIQADG